MTNAPAARRLDPRAPLVIDTRELGRRPGSMRRVARTVPAPPSLEVAMVGVPPDAPMEVRLRLEAVMEGVLVSGSVRAPLRGECARCLEPFTAELEVDLQELYVYPDLALEDDEALRLEGELVDLEPALRDAVVVNLPLAPTCRDDCPGLCPSCGERLAELPAGHGHETRDPRWARLAGLGLSGLEAGLGGSSASPASAATSDDLSDDRSNDDSEA